ncbi:MAG: M64 family metallopeptidase [Nanoarchaeota archaeon]|nr:M64 family metallopeptidase [Nanoarchaeota archaeon]MBU1632731.1 M64 family metallopeptidase [Nanoarchaeota archaeon]
MNKMLIRGIVLLFVFSLTVNAFPDDDRDGIPNSYDKCPNTNSKMVDKNGCDCSQKICTEGKCIVEGLQLKCVQTCDDGILNQDEKGIDCGGKCQFCESKNQVRNDNSSIECTDCNKCGCQDNFLCQGDGSCKMKVNLNGKRCKTKDFFYRMSKFDCKEKGPDWVEENIGDFIKYQVGGVASGIPIVNDFVQKKAKEQFEAITVCIKTEDLGCAVSNVKCFGENQVTDENKKKAEKILQEEISKQVDNSIPWYADIVIDVEINVDLTNYHLDIPYDCGPKMADSRDSCQALIKNGDSKNKADILFIADGYDTEEELRSAVINIIDYDGNNFNTKNQGLFTEKIFQENKKKFNVWYMGTAGKLNYAIDKYLPSSGKMPVFKDIVTLSNKCSWYDLVVVISKNKEFRSNCMLGIPGPCRISLAGEKYPGRLVAHELGHGFASLADEYYNYVRRRETGFETFFAEFQTGPNCVKNKISAQSVWSGLSKEGLGFFNGCGGDCGKECASFVRPSLNSIMRNQDRKCTADTCIRGPPFDEYYSVNEREIMKVLKKYS